MICQCKNFFHSALKIITLFYILTLLVRIVASDEFGNVCVLCWKHFVHSMHTAYCRNSMRERYSKHIQNVIQ